MAAIAPICPLARELPYATGAAGKKKKRKKRNLGTSGFWLYSSIVPGKFSVIELMILVVSRISMVFLLARNSRIT